MPLMRCQTNGKRGWKYGRSGKCYAGRFGKAKAIKQMRAMFASGYRSKGK